MAYVTSSICKATISHNPEPRTGSLAASSRDGSDVCLKQSEARGTGVVGVIESFEVTPTGKTKGDIVLEEVSLGSEGQR